MTWCDVLPLVINFSRTDGHADIGTDGWITSSLYKRILESAVFLNTHTLCGCYVVALPGSVATKDLLTIRFCSFTVSFQWKISSGSSLHFSCQYDLRTTNDGSDYEEFADSQLPGSHTLDHCVICFILVFGHLLMLELLPFFFNVSWFLFLCFSSFFCSAHSICTYVLLMYFSVTGAFHQSKTFWNTHVIWFSWAYTCSAKF